MLGWGIFCPFNRLFLPGLRVRSLLTVEPWRYLNDRWHGPAMGCYGARHKRHTCQDAGAVDPNPKTTEHNLKPIEFV